MHYDKIREEYPQGRGDYHEGAKSVIEEYQDIGAWGRDETIAEAENKAEARKVWDSIADAVSVLVDAVNGNSADVVAKAMYIGVSRHHRTLQNKAVSAVFKFLGIYKDTAYDLRNHAAVIAAAQVTQLVEDESIVFPLI